MNVGDRVFVLGLLTHMHGRFGTVVSITDGFMRPYNIGVEFEPGGGVGGVGWFQPDALKVVNVVEALASLA